MYLMLGSGGVFDDSILGIFDLDNCSQSRLTRDFLAQAEKSEKIVNLAEDIPNSFLLCEDGAVCLSQATSRTLSKRLNQKNGELYGRNQ